MSYEYNILVIEIYEVYWLDDFELHCNTFVMTIARFENVGILL